MNKLLKIKLNLLGISSWALSCMIFYSSNTLATENNKLTPMSKEKVYSSLLKNNIRTTDASFIILDHSIHIDDILRTDSGAIGYARYRFTAKIITSNKSDSPINKEITYTQVYEGSKVPALNDAAYVIGVCNKTSNSEDWTIVSDGYKIPLESPALLSLAKSLINISEEKKDKQSRINICER